MAITYFQDTIFNTFDTLSAPGGTDSLQVAVNNTFSTRTYSLFVTVASKNNSVVIRLDGSIDNTNFAPIISNQTISSNGTTTYKIADHPVKYIKPVFVSEDGGTDATVTFAIAAV